MKRYDVILFSILGRGHWLASELSTKGLRVALLDCSALVTKSSQEQSEGPFGYFKTSQLRHSQIELLTLSSHLVENGFSVLSDQGPFEYNGPLSLYHLNQMMNSDSILETAFLGQKLNYINLLQYEYSSQFYRKNVEYFKSGSKLNLRDQFFVRFPDEESRASELMHLQKIKVDVYQNCLLTGTSFSKKDHLESVEVKSANQESAVLSADKFIFCLTPDQLTKMTLDSNNYFELNLPRPLFTWAMFDFKIQLEGKYQLPLYFLLLADVDQHWVGENYLLIKKSKEAERYNVWCKIPYDQKDNNDYINEKAGLVKNVLKNKFSFAEINLVKVEVEEADNFPMYSRWVRSKSKYENIEWNIPYFWEHLNINGQLDHQVEILKRLALWWTKKQEQLQKKERKLARGLQ